MKFCETNPTLTSSDNSLISIRSTRRTNVGSLLVMSNLQKFRKSCDPTRCDAASRIRSKSRSALKHRKFDFFPTRRKIIVELTEEKNIDKREKYNRTELIFHRQPAPKQRNESNSAKLRSTFERSSIRLCYEKRSDLFTFSASDLPRVRRF